MASISGEGGRTGYVNYALEEEKGSFRILFLILAPAFCLCMCMRIRACAGACVCVQVRVTVQYTMVGTD